MSSDMFKKLKQGLSQCRDTKESVWDSFADVKDPKGTEEEQAEQIKQLQELHSTLTAHMSALKEASAKQEPPIDAAIKAEEVGSAAAIAPAAATAASDAGASDTTEASD